MSAKKSSPSGRHSADPYSAAVQRLRVKAAVPTDGAVLYAARLLDDQAPVLQVTDDVLGALAPYVSSAVVSASGRRLCGFLDVGVFNEARGCGWCVKQCG